MGLSRLADRPTTKMGFIADELARQGTPLDPEDNVDSLGAVVGAVGSQVANFLSYVWTDDFSKVPVVGPAASGLAKGYQETVDTTYNMGSAALLAANPMQSNDDLRTDAENTNIGDAATALTEFIRYSLPDSGIFRGPNINGRLNIYDENVNFNVANKSQRDVAFDGETELELASGLMSGIYGWFTDPLVVVGKTKKVLSQGTRAFGLDVAGFGNRQLITNTSKNGFSGRVQQTVDPDADQALAFFSGKAQNNSRIGIIAQQVVERDFDALKKLVAFNGSNGAYRDILAGVASSIDNVEDATIFLAAATGSQKYLKILKDKDEELALALAKGKNSGRYETAALNIPQGKTALPVLPRYLESTELNPNAVVEAAMKRSTDLRAAVLGLTGPDAGKITQLGGSSVKGMEIMAAWRGGVLARSREVGAKNMSASKSGVNPISQVEPRNVASTKAIGTRYGTAPAVQRAIYQTSSHMPRFAVYDWIRGTSPNGWLTIRGLNVGKGSDELEASFSDTKSLGKDRAFVQEQLRIWGEASGADAKFRATKTIELNAFERLAEMEGVKDIRFIREAYELIDKKRDNLVKTFRESRESKGGQRAYGTGVDPTDGTTMVATAQLMSQLDIAVPMLNMRMLEKAAKMAKKQEDRYLTAFEQTRTPEAIAKGIGGQVATAYDEILSLWKAGTLLRGGYTVRNTVEGWARSAVYLGTVPGAGQLNKTASRSLFNNNNRFVGAIPGRGNRAIMRQRASASEQINKLKKDAADLEDSVRITKDTPQDVAVIAAEINEKKARADELTETILKLDAALAKNLERKYLGDDAAFGGELNEALGDLYRDLSSAQKTNDKFLKSRFMREHEGILSNENWSIVKPSDSQYWETLTEAARQFDNDMVARMLLDGEDVATVVAWASGRGKGRTWRNNMGVPKESVPEHVVEIDLMMRRYFPTEGALNLVKSGKYSDGGFRRTMGKLVGDEPPTRSKFASDTTPDELAKAEASFQRKLKKYNDRIKNNPVLSPIHGRVLQSNTNTNLVSSTYGLLVDTPVKKFFQVLGTYPESALVRHPFYNEVWMRNMDAGIAQYKFNNGLVKTVDNKTLRTELKGIRKDFKGDRAGRREASRAAVKRQDPNLTDDVLEEINQQAHKAALRATNEVLFTIERYSNPAAAMRWASPFFAAWENSAKVWTKMIINDPSVLARANQLWNIPAQLGMIVDNEGNKVDATLLDFLQGSEDQYIVAPDSMADAIEKLSGGAVRIPRASFNVVTPGATPFLPGFGPMVTLSAGQFLKGKPDLQKTIKDTVGMALYEQIAPFGVINDDLVKSFAPAWVRQALAAVQQEDNRDYMKTSAAMMQIAMVDWYKSGGAVDNKPDMEEVLKASQKFHIFQTIARLTLPVTTSRSSKYQIQMDAWRQIRDRDSGETYNEKLDYFLGKWGTEFLPLVVSGSDSAVPGVQSTQEVYKVLKDNPELSRKLAGSSPEMLGILATSVEEGEFDKGVYKWMSDNKLPGIDENYRATKSVEEVQRDILMRGAWAEYREEKDIRDEQLARMGVSLQSNAAEPIRRTWEEFKIGMVEKYGNVWFEEINTYQDKTAFFVSGIQMALNDSKFMKQQGGTPRWLGISRYFSERAMAMDAIARGEDSAEVKERFAQFVSNFRFSSLAFSDFYDRFLDGDDLTLKTEGLGGI